MSAEENTTPPEVLQRVIWIQTLTLIWMSMEAVASLGAAWMARSPSQLSDMSRSDDSNLGQCVEEKVARQVQGRP
jgi:hypothetical protein